MLILLWRNPFFPQNLLFSPHFLFVGLQRQPCRTIHHHHYTTVLRCTALKYSSCRTGKTFSFRQRRKWLTLQYTNRWFKGVFDFFVALFYIHHMFTSPGCCKLNVCVCFNKTDLCNKEKQKKCMHKWNISCPCFSVIYVKYWTLPSVLEGEKEVVHRNNWP